MSVSENKQGEGQMPEYKNHVLLDAAAKGFAIPAFNYSDFWEHGAIVQAAEEEGAIVYTASNMRVAGSIGIPYLGAIGRAAYEVSGEHIINHLDHSSSVDLCKQAIDNGYHSVMIDASMCSLEENIEKTREVVRYAHERGVVVEAEIGRILGRNVEGTFEGDDYLVQVEDAAAMAEETGVDSLAVGIGTAHGFYKEEPHINIERLKEVHARVKIPLVLHGGTGVPEDTVRECIANGMAKVNVGTLLHGCYVDTLRERMKTWEGTNISDLMEPVRDAIKEKVREWIRICGAQNRR